MATGKKEDIMYLMRDINHDIRKNIRDSLSEEEVTGVQMFVVKILHHHGALRITELSKKLSLSNSTVSGVVDRLEKKGIVVRTRSDEDRRVVMVDLEDTWKENSKSFVNEIKSYWDILLTQATESELDEIYHGLSILKNVMDRKEQL